MHIVNSFLWHDIVSGAYIQINISVYLACNTISSGIGNSAKTFLTINL